MTSTGSLARFRTRCNHFVVYEGYEGLYQRLRLGADNKSTKQSPIDRGNNCNNNNDESIFHLVGRVETRKCHLARQKSVRTHCCRTLKILSPGIKRLTSDIEFQEWVLYSLSHRTYRYQYTVVPTEFPQLYCDASHSSRGHWASKLKGFYPDTTENIPESSTIMNFSSRPYYF